MQNKNPFTAAMINFFFWGLGYVYCGKRTVFGYLIFIAFLFVHLPLIYAVNFSEIPGIFTLFGHITLSFAFAFDIIERAKIKHKEGKGLRNEFSQP